mgnify:CR=1
MGGKYKMKATEANLPHLMSVAKTYLHESG